MDETEKRSSQRLTYIDCIRGIAALYVLLQHALESAGIIAMLPATTYNFVLNFGQAGLVAFFLVSGFIIPVSLERSKSSADFWKHRILRIYPLYIVIFLCSLVIAVWFDGQAIFDPWIALPAQLFFVNSWVGLPDYVGVAWTLFIEVIWYVGIFVWWRIHGHLASRRLFILAILFFIALAVFAVISSIRLPLGRFGMLLACVIGLLVLERTRGTISRNFFFGMLAAMLACVIALLYIGFSLRPSEHADLLTFSVIMSSWALGGATFAFFYLFKSSTIARNSVLAYFGAISYSVYLVHSPVIHVLSRYMSGITLVCIAVSVTFVISHLTYHWIEKPFVRLGHKKAERPVLVTV